MGKNWWSEPMGGCDSEGNPITVSFGSGPKEGHTLIGDGDRSGGMGVGQRIQQQRHLPRPVHRPRSLIPLSWT